MENDTFNLPGFEYKKWDIPGQYAHALTFTSESPKFRTTLKFNPLNISKEFIFKYSEQIKTLAFNKINFPNEIFRSESAFEDYIKNTFPSLSPDEIVIQILYFIYNKLDAVGKIIELTKHEITESHLWRYFYLKNSGELHFYMEYLHTENLIMYDKTNHGYTALTVTVDGIRKIVKNHSNEKSNFCFVAMSFDKDILDTAYETAIKPALKQTGYAPIILTEEHVDSEKTINDAIISGLKKAHFTIADFTQHRNGVYFEAGYALGRGQKVIYTCSEADMKEAHFDTRNFQHIVWKNPDDLFTKLVAKIEAFIND